MVVAFSAGSYLALFVLIRIEISGIPVTNSRGFQKVISFWPNAIIPYRIPDNYDQPEVERIKLSMQRWETKTCVTFVQAGSSDRNYINFIRNGGCFSEIGSVTNQPQPIGIGSRCTSIQTIVHELGHAIGLVHEMGRPDRDFYLKVLYHNINKASWPNFNTTAESGINYNTFGTPYDYTSIMHYRPTEWAKRDRVSMITKDPAYQDVIGHAYDISYYDAKYVNLAYNCTEKCVASRLPKCKHGGYRAFPKCNCQCESGFVGDLCELLLLGSKHIVNWRCQRNFHFVKGSCYRFTTGVYRSFHEARNYCDAVGAKMLMVKNRWEVVDVLQLIQEKIGLSQNTTTFWVGLHRAANTRKVSWVDGTPYDSGMGWHISDSMPITEEACAFTEGRILMMAKCDAMWSNDVICVKAFDPDCGGRYRVGEEPIYVQSPGFPSSYPGDLMCEYVFQTRENWKIEVTFVEFRLDTNCRKDFVELRLLKDFTHKGRRYCDTQLRNQTVWSTTNLALIRFRSSKEGSASGFRMSARAVPDNLTVNRGWGEMPMLLHALLPNRTESKMHSLWELLSHWAVDRIFS